MPTKLFDGMSLNAGEKEFVSNVLKDDKTLEVKTVYMQQAQILATLKLAKEIENGSRSSDKAASAMNWLTFGIFVIAAVEVIINIIC